MEIVFIECANEFLVLLFHRLHIDLRSILVTIRIKVIGEEYPNIIKTLHVYNSRINKSTNEQNIQI